MINNYKRSCNSKYKYIIFDFDGVLAESNEVRFEGFQLLFKNYPDTQVNKLVEYAKLNGGISRYEKIRYFFESIRNESISDESVQDFAKQYSYLVKQKVIGAFPVKGSLEFLNRYKDKYVFSIVSGSDQNELRDVCKERRIDNFFVEILGSPVSKDKNIFDLLFKREWKKNLSLYVGDSINDLHAAQSNGIDFIGRNSGLAEWGLCKNVSFVNDLSQLHLHLGCTQK